MTGSLSFNRYSKERKRSFMSKIMLSLVMVCGLCLCTSEAQAGPLRRVANVTVNVGHRVVHRVTHPFNGRFRHSCSTVGNCGSNCTCGPNCPCTPGHCACPNCPNKTSKCERGSCCH